MLVLVVVPLGSYMVGYIKTESVESNFVYLQEGCGKTRIKINATMPHTCIVQGIDTECANLFIHVYKK